jgi:TonB family protein
MRSTQTIFALSLLSALVSTAAYGQAPAADAPLTKLPQLRTFSEAVYPPAALRDRVEARVVLELTITASGAVESVSLVSSSTRAAELPAGMTRTATITDHGFARAATRAAKGLVFSPAEAGGVPVPVTIEYAYNFKLPPPPPPPPPVAAGEAPPPAPREERFRGVARERGTRTRIAGAVVTVFRGDGKERVGFEATTDAEGAFVFFDLEPGEWKVLVEKPGYFPARTTETMRAGEVVEATYYLENGADNPYAVVVEAERVKKEVNRRALSRAEIVRVPGTLGDPIQVVENLPGVARPPPFSGQLIVRGSGPQDSGVFIDNITVPLIFHFGGLRSVIPADVIEGVEFWPGNYPANYGRFTGGIYNARIRRPSPDQLHGAVELSLLDGSIYLEAPVTDTLSVAVAGRRSWIDAVLNAAIPEDSFTLLTAPRYYDWQVISTWRPTPRDTVQVIVLGSDDQFRAVNPNPAAASTQVRTGSLNFTTNFNRVIGEYRHSPGERYQNDLRLSVGRDRAAFRLGDQLRFELDVLAVELRDQASWKVSDALSFSAGVDSNVAIADVEVLLPRPPNEGDPPRVSNLENEVVFDKVTNQVYLRAAPFVESVISLGDRLSLVPSARVDYFSDVGEFSFDPRLVARWQLAKGWLAKGGVGLVHQAPTEAQTNAVFGNPDLGLQRAVHYSLGSEWTPRDHLRLDCTFFYKDLQNLVDGTSATTQRNGQTVPLNLDNGGRGRVYGVELFAEHKIHKNFRGWLSYTLSRAERFDSGGDAVRLFDFDQTHILNVVASYLFPENFELGLRWRLVSGNPFTPFVGGAFNNELDRFVPISAPSNSGRLPVFHQLDLRVDKRWVWDAWSLSAFLSLVNTYNRANTEGYSYNFDYSQRTALQGLPVLPILGVRGEF